MCGIVGYTGKGNITKILIDGLKRLEYRGYDSAGIAVLNENSKIKRRRCKGKISKLQEILNKNPLKGNSAVGHTRWATHGAPSDENAHPHIDCTGKLVLVHNGIIENHVSLKNKLIKKGHKFTSDTDTEVIIHLIEEHLKKSGDFIDSVFKTVKELKGSYALGIINSENPGEIVAARKASPLIVGIGEKGNFIASDVPAILPYTKKVIYPDDDEIIHVTPDSVNVFNKDKRKITKEIKKILWNPLMAEKQGYKHFMLKEIYEQQRAIEETIMGRIDRIKNSVKFEHFDINEDFLKKISRIYLVACGTAFHACLVGKFLLEDRLKIPCEVDIASEFRYRNPPVDQKSLIIAVSQSGETADTLAAMQEAKKRKAKVGLICNVVGSSATRKADGVIYTHAGPEIGVASTKAFTSQLIAFYLLTVYLGKVTKNMSGNEAKQIIENLTLLPLKVKKILDTQQESIEKTAHKYFKKQDFLYLGRNINYPIALEGALKLKEISYIHAEGYPAGEMKHGPIALIDQEMPVVVIATRSIVYEKIISNIQEVKARDGIVIAVANENDKEIAKLADEVIFVPETMEIFSPLLNTIPLQLLAYHIARLRGCDIDQPRNLAKSVTVE